MNKELFESTEFYNKRYQNFPTIIIIPIFILLLVIIVLMSVGRVDVTINSKGNVMPLNKVINIPNNQKNNIIKQPSNNEIIKKNQIVIQYKNGKKIKSPADGIFYKSKSTKYLGSIYPNINTKNKLMTKIYVTSKDIGSIKKGQQVNMSLHNNKQNILLKGYVNDYSYLPETYKGNSYYEVTCYLRPNENNIKDIFYGMNGQIDINTGKISVIEYIQNTFS